MSRIALDDVALRLRSSVAGSSSARSARYARTVPAHVRKSFAVTSGAIVAEVVVDVVGRDVDRLAVLVDVLEQLLAGQVAAAPDDRGEAPVAQARPRAACPDLPRNRKRIDEPRTDAWRSRSVVSPNERFSRAYSSLPTRISVSSSRRTTAARTFSRGRPGRPRSRVDAARGSPAAPGRTRSAARTSPTSRRAPVAGVVAVLLAAPRVAAGRLEVAVRVRADPDVGPGRRDRERPDPVERLVVADPPSVGVDGR